jgi:hypothetical protein
MSDKRTYTIHSSSLSKKGGNYKSQSPGLAAKKACSQLLRSKSDDGEKECTFELRELGVHDRVYCYEGKRKLKDKPLIVKMGGKDISIKWDYIVKPCSPATKSI